MHGSTNIRHKNYWPIFCGTCLSTTSHCLLGLQCIIQQDLHLVFEPVLRWSMNRTNSESNLHVPVTCAGYVTSRIQQPSTRAAVTYQATRIYLQTDRQRMWYTRRSTTDLTLFQLYPNTITLSGSTKQNKLPFVWVILVSGLRRTEHSWQTRLPYREGGNSKTWLCSVLSDIPRTVRAARSWPSA